MVVTKASSEAQTGPLSQVASEVQFRFWGNMADLAHLRPNSPNFSVRLDLTMCYCVQIKVSRLDRLCSEWSGTAVCLCH